MFDHVTVRASDRSASERFYALVLGTLGTESTPQRRALRGMAVNGGYRDNGSPGERPVYHAGYHAAFVLDPDGNNVELVNHNRRS